MKAAVRDSSRNQRRKRDYAAQADKSSRNEVVLAGPIVRPGGPALAGAGEVVESAGEVPAAPAVVVSRDAASCIARSASRRRRQESAWRRCVERRGAHRGPGNCVSCGCPASVRAAAGEVLS